MDKVPIAIARTMMRINLIFWVDLFVNVSPEVAFVKISLSNLSRE